MTRTSAPTPANRLPISCETCVVRQPGASTSCPGQSRHAAQPACWPCVIGAMVKKATMSVVNNPPGGLPLMIFVKPFDAIMSIPASSSRAAVG